MGAQSKSKEERVGREEREVFENRIARAFGHPIRVRIMELLNERDAASAADISRVIGIHTSNLSYHFGVLAECDCIELVERVPVRGTVKNVYRSKQATMLADLAWSALSIDVRSEISRTMLNNTLRRLGDALGAATFDAKENRHLSLQTVSVDWEGWDEIGVLLDETMSKVEEIEQRAVARAEEQDRFPATVTLLGYESPRMYEVR